jgi:hypothetical protein
MTSFLRMDSVIGVAVVARWDGMDGDNDLYRVSHRQTGHRGQLAGRIIHRDGRMHVPWQQKSAFVGEIEGSSKGQSMGRVLWERALQAGR